MKLKVAILFGGKSVEHEVSIISGLQAYNNIDKEKYDVFPVYISKNNDMYIGDMISDIDNFKDINKVILSSQKVILLNEDNSYKFITEKNTMFKKKKEWLVDLVLPIVHGTNEEDGALQGYLKTIGVPFAGCDVTSSAVGMDKYIQKLILRENGVPVLPALKFNMGDYEDTDILMDKIEKNIGYPVIVKPINLGSSVGISVAKDRKELISSIDEAFLYTKNILCEHAILNLREVNCAVLGDEVEAFASEIEEPMHTKDILSYEDKYGNGQKNGSTKGDNRGMASLKRQIPAKLDKDMYDEIKALSVKSFKALGCNGVARIDFMIDTSNNKLYFNEINTIPGSLAFYLFEPIGIPYFALLDRIIELAEDRKRMENDITYSFDTNILTNLSGNGSKGSKR